MTESKDRILKWIRSDGKEGFKPNFPIICHHCNEPMFLRNSELRHQVKNSFGIQRMEPVLRVMYKCIPCAQVYWFHIGYPYMDNDYWNELLKRREDYMLYVPPPETWSENAKIQQRLKDLGYLGGDIHYEDVTDIEDA